MAKESKYSSMISAHYDDKTDILTFSFSKTPQPAVAEEAADEVWVRFDPTTHRVITVDVLNFSERVRTAFGAHLIYTERTDPQRVEELHGLLEDNK